MSSTVTYIVALIFALLLAFLVMNTSASQPNERTRASEKNLIRDKRHHHHGHNQVPGQILVPVNNQQQMQLVPVANQQQMQLVPVANQQQFLVPAQPQLNVVAIPDPRCYWAGTPPFCKPKCTKTFEVYRKDSKGDGMKCLIGKKSLCCPKKNNFY